MNFFGTSFLFVSFFLLFATNGFTQCEIQEKRNLFKLSLDANLGISNGRSAAGMWHKANRATGVSAQFGASVFDNFWLNLGISYDVFRYRSKPFIHSGSYYYYYGSLPGGPPIGWWIDFTEDFERISERNSTYLTFPVSIEYSSPKEFGWYSEAGVSFGTYLKDEEINRRNDSKEVIHWTSGVVQKIGTPYNSYSLFLNLSGGFQIRKKRSMYKIGVAYDHIVANYGYETWERGVHALRLEFGIEKELTGNKVRRLAARNFDNRIERKNYVYLELVGNAFANYSLNYERSLIAKEKFRFNVRYGDALSKGEDDEISNLFLLGGLCSFGRVHAIEIGLNGVYNAISDGNLSSNEFALIPTFGYRFEHESGLFSKVILSPQFFVGTTADERSFLPLPGISLGWNF